MQNFFCLNSTARSLFAIPLLCVGVFAFASAFEDTASDQPKPIPQSRPEIKVALEALKWRKPRLPLDSTDADPASDGRIVVGNGAARRKYLPSEWFAADFGQDPNMTLDYGLKTQCFWVVSRGNNCQYCLGHQEHKLSAIGMSDDEIAMLDYDWDRLPPKLQASLALARKMTIEPWSVSKVDVDTLREFYSENEIIELVYTISMFNSVNRWTDALGIPQDQTFRSEPVHFDQPTSERFTSQKSLASVSNASPRPATVPFEGVLKLIEDAKLLQAHVTVPTDEQAAKYFAEQNDLDRKLASWERALSVFPKVGGQQVRAANVILSQDSALTARQKCELLWFTARQNHAHASLSLAFDRLQEQGLSVAEISDIDELKTDSVASKLAWQFAQKLSSTPQQISDADIQTLRKHYTDHQVAEMVYVIGLGNLLDRFTATLSIPSESR